jgi:hypothetical protein
MLCGCGMRWALRVWLHLLRWQGRSPSTLFFRTWKHTGMNSSYDTSPSLSTSMCDRMRLMSLRVRPSSAALSASLNSCLRGVIHSVKRHEK